MKNSISNRYNDIEYFIKLFDLAIIKIIYWVYKNRILVELVINYWVKSFNRVFIFCNSERK